MSLFPKPYDHGQKVRTDVNKLNVSRMEVVHFPIGEPAVADEDSILSVTALEEENEQEITEFDSQPDVPRTLTIEGGQGGMDKDVVVTGKNVMGEEISETFTCDGSNTIAGEKAFMQIDKAVLPTWNTDGDDTVSIGFGAKVALPYKMDLNTVLAAYLNGVLETTAPTITTSSLHIEQNTIELDSAFNGNAVEVIMMI